MSRSEEFQGGAESIESKMGKALADLQATMHAHNWTTNVRPKSDAEQARDDYLESKAEDRAMERRGY